MRDLYDSKVRGKKGKYEGIPSPPVLTKPGPYIRSYRKILLWLYSTLSKKRWKPLSSCDLTFCHIQQICATKILLYKNIVCQMGKQKLWITLTRNGNPILLPGFDSSYFEHKLQCIYIPQEKAQRNSQYYHSYGTL